ncbi:MAG: hypothetical protein ACRDUY_11920 [Nitriliruptorales bacterium]
MNGLWALLVVLILPFALGAGALWLDRVFRDVPSRQAVGDAELAEDATTG